jgi:thiol-disulfide isomerase/thioredoxin
MNARWCALLLGVLLCGGGRAEFNLTVKTENVRLGKALLGSVSADDLKGRVVVLEFWGINCAPCLASLPKMAALNRELSPFGLLLVGAHAQNGTEEQVKATARARGVNFPVVQSASVQGGNDFNGIPHCMVFDHKGKCVYRGSPATAELAARRQVGATLADAAGKSAAKPVANLVTSLESGASPALVLRRAVPLLRSADATTNADAKRLVAALTAQGQKQLDEAEKLLSAEPVRAYDLALLALATYKGTPVGTRAGEVAGKLKREKPVQAELQARPHLEAIRKLDAALAPRVGPTVDPKGPEFQKAFARQVKQMRSRLAQMKKVAPDAPATAEATAIAEKYGAS